MLSEAFQAAFSTSNCADLSGYHNSQFKKASLLKACCILTAHLSEKLMLSLLAAHFYGHYPSFHNIWLSVVLQIVAVLGSSFSNLKRVP